MQQYQRNIGCNHANTSPFGRCKPRSKEPLNRSNWSWKASHTKPCTVCSPFPVRQDDPSISSGPSSRACFWAPGVSGPTRVTSTTASPSFTSTRSMGVAGLHGPESWLVHGMVCYWGNVMGFHIISQSKKRRLLVESSDI